MPTFEEWCERVGAQKTNKAAKRIFDDPIFQKHLWGYKISFGMPTEKTAQPSSLYLKLGKSGTGKVLFAFKAEKEFHRGVINDYLSSEELSEIQASLSKTPPKLSEKEELAIFNAIQNTHPEVHRQITLEEAKKLHAKLIYKDFDKAPEIAQLCYQYGKNDDPVKTFDICVALFHWKKLHDLLPDVHIDGSDIGYPGYHFVKLPASDINALFMGEITDCCQSIDHEYGYRYARDSWLKQNNGVYMLLKAKKANVAHQTPFLAGGDINYEDYEIVGQSYAWRSKNGNIVLNIWTVLKKITSDDISAEFLKAFAKKLVTDPSFKIFRVCVGRGLTGEAYRTEHARSLAIGKKITGETAPEINEYMIEGEPTPEFTTQRAIYSRTDENQGRLWEDQIEKSLENLSFDTSEKKTLIENAPPNANYIILLRACETNDFLFKQIKHSTQVDASTQKNILGFLSELFTLFPINIIEHTFKIVSEIEGLNYESRGFSDFVTSLANLFQALEIKKLPSEIQEKIMRVLTEIKRDISGSSLEAIVFGMTNFFESMTKILLLNENVFENPNNEHGLSTSQIGHYRDMSPTRSNEKDISEILGCLITTTSRPPEFIETNLKLFFQSKDVLPITFEMVYLCNYPESIEPFLEFFKQLKNTHLTLKIADWLVLKGKLNNAAEIFQGLSHLVESKVTLTDELIDQVCGCEQGKISKLCDSIVEKNSQTGPIEQQVRRPSISENYTPGFFSTHEDQVVSGTSRPLTTENKGPTKS